MPPAGPSNDPEQELPAAREKDLRELGLRVAHRREELGLTLATLAEQVGVHHSTLSRLERGVQDLGASRLPSLARALDLGIGDLFPPA